MTGWQRWLRWLRSPRGQILAILALLIAALPGAAAIALNRPFFERLVREKYEPAPTAEVQALAQAIADGAAGVDEVRKRSTDDRDGLYAVWMTAAEGYAKLPPVVFAADPEHYRARLERTFAAGSPAQQLRAAEFARLAAAPSLRPTLEWARARATRFQRERVKAALGRAIESMVDATDTR